MQENVYSRKNGGNFKAFLISTRRLLAACLRRVQGARLYRKTARLFTYEMEIKEAKKEDLKNIQRFFRLKTANLLTERPGVTDFVAKSKGNVIGFVQLVRHPEGTPYHGYWLFSLTVKLFYRRMGIGERLSRAVMERAVREGARELSLLVFEDNLGAIGMYRNLGFEITVVPALEESLKKEKAIYGRRTVIMRKVLG
jgi:ribosomal protein S18 acetylase RimI-like enzyme